MEAPTECPGFVSAGVQSSFGTAAGVVAVGDLDGDGNPDIVALDHGNVDIYWSNGDGTYSSPDVYDVGTNLQSVVLADFNADGSMDIAVADSATGTVTILYGDSLYYEFDSQSVLQIPAPSSPVSLVAGDFNGDGVPDLAVGQNNGQNLVTILMNDGTGNFLYPQNYGTGGSQGITVGDFNGDGNLDIAASTGANVSVLLGKGDGTFQPQVNSAAAGVGSITSGDFNGDGKMDVALANNASVVVALGKGDGTFNAATSYPVSVPASSIATADFNQDGHLDLAASSAVSGSSATSVLTGVGDGTFQTPKTYAAGGLGGIAIADMDGNNTPDIVALDGPDGTISLLLSGIVSTSTLANIDIVGTGQHSISATYAPGYGVDLYRKRLQQREHQRTAHDSFQHLSAGDRRGNERTDSDGERKQLCNECRRPGERCRIEHKLCWVWTAYRDRTGSRTRPTDQHLNPGAGRERQFQRYDSDGRS